MESTPFTEPINNGARIAALHINEGTAALREHFERLISEKYKCPLIDVLPKEKQRIQSYYNGDKNIPRLLTKPQIDLLYPKKGNAKSESFDISLLALLINIVCKEPPPPYTQSWLKPPDDRDMSFAADVVRLGNLRNDLYGHISHQGMDDNDFNRRWMTLKGILLRLGVSEEHIVRWRSEPMDRDCVSKLRTELTAQIENDLETLREMAKAVFTINQDFKRLEETMTQEVNEIMSFLQGKLVLDEFVAANILEMCSPHVMAILQNIKSSSSDQSSQLDALLTGQKKHSEDLGAIRNELYLDRRKNQNEAPDTLKEIEQKYKCSEGSSINILIMNGPSGEDVCRQLGDALGNVPWHIIIDLDHKSQGSTGLYDCVTQALGKQKIICAVTYKDAKTLSHDDKISIASGNKSLWIQANGCCVKNHNESLKKFSIAKHTIDCLIGDILERTPDSQNVVCTTLLMDKCDNDTTKAFVKLLEVVQEACERKEDFIKSDQYIGLATSVNQHVLDELQEKQTMIVGLATFSQIADLILYVFQKDRTSSYHYPGHTYSCHLSQEEMTRMSGTLQLYHLNYGKIDFDKLSADEIKEKTSTIRANFHKGGIITSEALYLDATHQEDIYVHRCEMKKIESEVCRELESKKLTSRKQKPPFVTKHQLKHTPCSGGTTCIKHLLFSLKDKYPCVELLHLNEYANDTLKNISSNSKLPMLLAVDDPEFTTSDLESLQSRLCNDLVHGVLIHTTQVKSDPNGDSWYMPASINNERDLACFKKMYDNGLKDAQTRRVFMFGFLTFLGAYTRLDQHIHLCCENMTHSQKRIVRLACGVYKFGRVGLKSRIVEKLLGPSDRSMLDQLGGANDILIYDNRRNEFRPAVRRIVDKIMETLDPTSGGERLRNFIRDFEFVIKNEHCTEIDTTPLVRSVFIQRETQSAEEHRWSPFICALEKTCGKDYVTSVLENIAVALRDHNQGKHMLTLKARYLMYRINKPDEAIREICKVHGLQNDESIKNTAVKDNLLLSAYGHLYKEYVGKCFRLNQGNLDHALEQAKTHSSEAIRAFEMAQNSKYYEEQRTKHSALPFLGEVRVRYYLLLIYLQHKFKNNLKKFRTFIRKSKDELFNRSDERAAKTLARLESLIERDMVHDNNPVETHQDILRLKFDFLALRAEGDLQKSETLRHGINGIAASVCLDIGAMLRKEQTPNQMKSWRDMLDEELEFLIVKIHDRVHLENILSANFNDLILAIVHMRNRGHDAIANISFNIGYTRQCAETWAEKYSQDHRAHFTLGVLTFIQAMEEKSHKYFLDSKIHLDKCREICVNSMKGLKIKRYFLGDRDGLARLVPKEYKDDERLVKPLNLHTFIGRQIGPHVIIARFGDNDRAFEARISESKSKLRTAKTEQPLVQFEVALAFDNIMAINVRNMSEFQNTTKEN